MRDESAGSEDDELMEVVEKKQPKKKPSAAPSEAKKKSSKPKVDSSSSEEESDTTVSKKRKRELASNGSSKKGKEATGAGAADTNGKAKQRLRPANGKDDVSSADSSEELKPAPKRTKHSKQDSEEEEEEEAAAAPKPKKKQSSAVPELKKKGKEADPSPKSDKPKKKKASAESGSESDNDENASPAYPDSSFYSLVKMKKDKTPHVEPEKVAAFVGTEACLVALEPVIRSFLENAFSSGDKYKANEEVDLADVHGQFFDALRTALFDEGSERRKYSHKMVIDGLAPLTGIFHTKSDVAGYTTAEKEYLQASARYFTNHQGFAVCPTSKGNRVVGAKNLFRDVFRKTPVEVAEDSDMSLKKIQFDEFVMNAVGGASHYQVLKQTELMEDFARVKTLPSLTFGMLAETLEHLRKTKSFVGCASGVLMVRHILEAFAKKSKGKRAPAKSTGGGKQSSPKGRANSTEDEEDDEVRDVDEVIEAKRREKAKSKAAAVSVPDDELAAGEHAEDAAPAAANASRRFSDQE
jgi:hypothetical protein